jgi:hypothetical protein
MEKLCLGNLIHASFSIRVHVSTGRILIVRSARSVSPWQHRRRVVQASPVALTSEDAATDASVPILTPPEPLAGEAASL